MKQRHGAILRTLTSCLWARNAEADSSRLKGENGSTLVEFAVVFILFATILFGIAGFGHALYVYHFVSHAAKSATRWAAVNGATCGPGPTGDGSCNGQNGMSNGPATGAGVLAYVKSLAPPGIDTTKITTPIVCGVQGVNCADSVPTFCATTPNDPGCAVEVQVSYSYSFIFPLISSKAWTLSSTSEMIISH